MGGRGLPFALAAVAVLLAVSCVNEAGAAAGAAAGARVHARLAKAQLKAARQVLQADADALSHAGSKWVAMQKSKNNRGVHPFAPFAAADNTDGEMHLLRTHWADVIRFGLGGGNPVTNLNFVPAAWAVGDAAAMPVADVAVAHANGHYHTNPQGNALVTHTDMVHYLSLTTAPLDERTFVTTHRATLRNLAAGPAVVIPPVGLVPVPPGWALKYANCHVEIREALMALSGAGTVYARADVGFGQVFPGAATCDLNQPLATAVGAARAAFALHPAAADLVHYNALAHAPPLDERAFVTTHRGALAILAAGPAVALGAPPGAKYANCHAEVISALIALGGAGGVPLAQANRGFTAAFGNAASCDLNQPLATGVAAARVVNARVSVQALEAHYTRVMALLGVAGNAPANVDIWELRGWLYATDRRYGHRLEAATGTAADTACPRTPHTNYEMALMRTQFNNGGAPQDFGYVDDTIGHVRPQSMGGDRDPLNFLPQSKAGQKMMQPAESLALNIAKAYGADFARYTVLYTYAGNGRTDRRPTHARTVVDMLQNGAPNPALGNVALPAGNVFNENFLTY